MSPYRNCPRTEAVRAAAADPRGLSSAQRDHVATCADCREALWLSEQMAALAATPVGRGRDASAVWARAEVLRRLELDAAGEARRRSTVAWGPPIGAAVAVAVVLALALLWPGPLPGSEAALGLGAWLALGSLVTLAMAAVASVALIWGEL